MPITKKTSLAQMIHDFVNSDDPKFANDSKEQRKKRAIGAWYSMHKESLDEMAGPAGMKHAQKHIDDEVASGKTHAQAIDSYRRKYRKNIRLRSDNTVAAVSEEESKNEGEVEMKFTVKELLEAAYKLPKHSGGTMDGKVDKRYTIAKEFEGHPSGKAQHVVRFADKYVGSAESKEGAEKIAREHWEKRQKELEGKNEAELDEVDFAAASKSFGKVQPASEIAPKKSSKPSTKRYGAQDEPEGKHKEKDELDEAQNQLDEVMGFTMKAHQKKAVEKFFDKVPHDTKDFSTDGKSLHSGGPSGVLAKHKPDGSVDVNIAYGNVSQTYKNHIEREAKKRGIKTQTITNLKEGNLDEEMSHGARELTLYADNDSKLYHSSHEPIVANLKKKAAKGQYDHEKAKKLWAYHADKAAQAYHKEFGEKHTPWHKMFPKSERTEAAAHFADTARDEHGFGK